MDEDRDPLEQLSEEFLRRHRSGDAVDAEEYARQHPTLAAEIRSLFPTLLQLEGACPPEPARAEDRFGPWRVVRELGRGGMGVVYLAQDAAGRHVALKTLAGGAAESAVRFRREAQAASRVSHPGLCAVVDVSPEGERPWIAFEFLDGRTVAQVLRRERVEATRRKPSDWLAVGEQVARALHVAHEHGLIHRDIKPGNIMLVDGPGGAAGLWPGPRRPHRRAHAHYAHGCADRNAGVHVTRAGACRTNPVGSSDRRVLPGRDVVRSPHASGPRLKGPRLRACSVAFCRPDPEPARDINPALSRDQALVLHTALAKEPDRRYATARALADDLARARTGERVRARPLGVVRRVRTWARRNPVTAFVLAALGLALTTGLIVALVLLARVRQARDDEALAARRARARALASAAATMERRDASLSLLLAREAVHAKRSPDTITRLHASVHAHNEIVRLSGHAGRVSALAWSHDGTHLLTADARGDARLFRADGTRVCVVPAPDGAGGGIRVALSPSARWLTVHRESGHLGMWSQDGTHVRTLGTPAATIRRAAVLGDDVLALVRTSGEITIHDGSGTQRHAWQMGEQVLAAYGDSDPPRLVILTTQGSAITYDEHGRELNRRVVPEGAFDAQLFGNGRLAWRMSASSGDGERLQVPAGDRVDGFELAPGAPLHLAGSHLWWSAWSPSTGVVIVRHAPRPATHRVLDLRRGELLADLLVSPEGDKLCTVRNTRAAPSVASGSLRIWTAKAQALCDVTSSESLSACRAFSPDGDRIAIGWHAGGLATIHTTRPFELAACLTSHAAPVRSEPAMITADGTHFAVAVHVRRIRVLRDDGTVRSDVSVDQDTAAVRLHPTLGRLLLVHGEVRRVSLYDLDGTPLVSHGDGPSAQAAWIGSEGAYLTQVGDTAQFHDPSGAVIATHTGRFLGPPPLRGWGRHTLVMQGSDLLICDTKGHVVRTLTVAKGLLPQFFHESTTGRFLLLLKTGRVGSTCRCYEADGTLRWSVDTVSVGRALAMISADGKRSIVAGSRGLSLRDADGTEVAHLALRGGLAAADIDRTSGRIVASSRDGTVRVWNRDGNHLFDLPPHGRPCEVVFSRDGRRIAASSSKGTWLFTTSVDELEALARARSTRSWSDEERAQYRAILAPPD